MKYSQIHFKTTIRNPYVKLCKTNLIILCLILVRKLIWSIILFDNYCKFLNMKIVPIYITFLYSWPTTFETWILSTKKMHSFKSYSAHIQNTATRYELNFFKDLKFCTLDQFIWLKQKLDFFEFLTLLK